MSRPSFPAPNQLACSVNFGQIPKHVGGPFGCEMGHHQPGPRTHARDGVHHVAHTHTPLGSLEPPRLRVDRWSKVDLKGWTDTGETRASQMAIKQNVAGLTPVAEFLILG